MKNKAHLNLPVLVLIMIIGFPLFAHAYLDPGTFSYVLQLVLTLSVGALVAVYQFWGRIKKAIRSTLLKSGQN